MVFLLGASGYIGQAFGKEMTQRGIPFRPVARKEINYADYRVLRATLQKEKPEFVINAGGFTGKPNVDACENQLGETIAGNVTLATKFHVLSRAEEMLFYGTSQEIREAANVLASHFGLFEMAKQKALHRIQQTLRSWNNSLRKRFPR